MSRSVPTKTRHVHARGRVRLFDIVGIAAVLLFAAALLANLRGLRFSGAEMTLDVSPEAMAEGFREGVAWHGFYLREAKVGFSRLEMRREGDGVQIRNHSLFNLNVMRAMQRIELDLTARLDTAMQLQSFEVNVDSELADVEATGVVRDGAIELTIQTAGVQQQTRLPFEHPPSFSFNLHPALMRQNPAAGQRYEFEFFDPISLGKRTITVEYLGQEQITLLGTTHDAHHLRQYIAGQALDAWVNDLGEVLQEELPLGVTAIRETEAEATYGLGTGSSLPMHDLIEAAAIPADDLPRSYTTGELASYLLSNVELDGLDLDGGRQQLVATSDPRGSILNIRRERLEQQTSRPAQRPAVHDANLTPYLRAELLLQVDDPEIRAMAAQITAGQETVRDAAQAITSWVFDSVAKTGVVGLPSAVEVLHSRRGDCNEHTALAVALLRAADIPARTSCGVAYSGGRFYYHAWLEYWDGRWVSADPTWDQHPADVGHIRLVIGGIDQQMKIMGLLGNLRISAADEGGEQ